VREGADATTRRGIQLALSTTDGDRGLVARKGEVVLVVQEPSDVASHGAVNDIVAEAAREVRPGSTIFIDASVISLALARRLGEQRPAGVTVVTNSTVMASAVMPYPLRVLVCPGTVNQQTRAIEGPLTVEFLEQQQLDTAFVSGASSIATAVRAIADRTVELADG
jgi:DeoR/GlpR family transcriptional regulator of sugar metabolism